MWLKFNNNFIVNVSKICTISSRWNKIVGDPFKELVINGKVVFFGSAEKIDKMFSKISSVLPLRDI